MTHLVKDLLDSGYLYVEGQEYPTLNITRAGQEMLEGIGTIVWRIKEANSTKAVLTPQPRERTRSVAALHTSLVDPELFERLRRLRLELAEEEGVAPFVIFHDKTLRSIAGYKPVTLSALLEIPGIGEVKVERYGRRVLSVVNDE